MSMKYLPATTGEDVGASGKSHTVPEGVELEQGGTEEAQQQAVGTATQIQGTERGRIWKLVWYEVRREECSQPSKTLTHALVLFFSNESSHWNAQQVPSTKRTEAMMCT